MTAADPSGLPRLLLVTDRRRTRGRDLVELVGRAVHGGVGWVQLREPDLPDDELRELMVRLRAVVPEGTLLSVNTSLRVARTTGVGLHRPARAAIERRPDLGSAPYGRSVHDDEELRDALAEQVDYVIAGTVFPTVSKPGRRPGGLALVERVCRLAHPVPVYAIGGISITRVPALLHAGAHGVAVCGAILSDNDPERVAQAMTLALEVSMRASAGPGPAPR
jgi:thiamine-phosphate pyrophosphorylase